MNGKKVIILIIALAATVLILWHDLPIAFPWVMIKVVMLFLKLFAVLAATVFAFGLVAGKKESNNTPTKDKGEAP